MSTRTFPINQRVAVRGKTIEELYKKLILWLHENNCKETRQNPPTEIEAEYSGDYTQFEVGPRDIYPKTLNIRLTDLGNNTQLSINIQQKTPETRDEGYLYWGIKLEKLYEELGVTPDQVMLSELIPERVLREKVDSKTKMVAVILIASVLIIAFLWSYFKDMDLMYKSVILLPIIALTIWDLQTYRARLNRRANMYH